MISYIKAKKEVYRLLKKSENFIKNLKRSHFSEFSQNDPYFIVNADNYIPFNYYNWDGCCDIWKEYYLSNFQSTKGKLEKLKENLDEESKKIVDLIYERYFFITPLLKDNIYYLFDKKQVYTSEELEEQNKILDIDELMKKYKLEKSEFIKSVFLYDNGLSFIKNYIGDYLKGKDFLDGGAFVGDSALVMQDYHPAKVYSFEPINLTYCKLNDTIIANNLQDKIIPVKLGLSNKVEEITLFGEASGASKFVFIEEQNANSEVIKTTTIDNFVAENNLNLGLIKLDIEGSELEAIQGALDSIIKYKPVLLISIYHHPKDFFEIKPLIESLNLDYKFIVKKLEPGCLCTETMLIAYPEIN
jgi:FkbM family methyltransferase